jgi:pseudaminic acid synthase
MTNDIHILDKKIGKNHPPFIIAEMSGNHNQSLERALSIVNKASEAGAHALKLQTYTADTMTLDICEGEFVIDDPNSLWNGSTLFQLYDQAHTPWEWHEQIISRCREMGMIPISTPFDASAVDFLEQFDLPVYKIASFENTDIPLIKRVAMTGKPVIISTGMATVAELDDSVAALRSAGCNEIILLKCTSTYPATPENTNVQTIPHMRELFKCEVGISDHTMGIGVSIASIALGATVIEKHFTLNRADGGVDSAFSLEPVELEQLVKEANRAWQALGQVCYGPSEVEEKSMQFRRSLYIVKDLRAGEVLTSENVRAIRPGLGLMTKHLDKIIGKTIKHAVKRGTALSWDLIL